jgi:hypothetical protein
VAKRILNRRALREQSDAAEEQANDEADEEATPAKPAKAAKTAKAAKPKAPAKPRARAKKAPVRMVARWGVFDGGMKQLALFPYNQRGAADEKVAELAARKAGTYFLQIVKEPMPEPAPAAGPA